ncbi:dihydroxyacetone kinase phosphoryl donor subunit DhaM [Micropruina sonneratiae]|uniref:dihydroxyacetone kinase phosphoryl donor subunit DhaM n=1 Tax=Micropruina sonneratiae TaxID=2986940 RepID=UPI0022265615|nr:dihydroxyacetone kinase phosphoryl donor subunit DhaM [Micropruina sp. KQZ13P-5]MCW3159540.1 dihydroxyacetone kinase phosphoryl donor subunit DhaM [Micropruina sp. KQZ13P-5]
MSIAFVIVSHSAKLAEGVVELAKQMAQDVEFRAAGGSDAGGIGTSFDLILTAVEELTGAGHQVALLTDLGSADMTVEAVLEVVDPDQVRFCPGPLVEGAVSAGVTAQIGGDLDAVETAARARELFTD